MIESLVAASVGFLLYVAVVYIRHLYLLWKMERELKKEQQQLIQEIADLHRRWYEETREYFVHTKPKEDNSEAAP